MKIPYRALAFAAVVVVQPALPAAACTLVPYKASNYRIDTAAIPRMMVAKAATVDLVTAQSVDRTAMLGKFDADEAAELAEAKSETDRAAIRADYVDLRDQWRRSGAGAVTYRVVERLKGSSSDTLTLNAFVPLEEDPDALKTLKQYVARRGAYNDPKATWVMRFEDLSDWGGLGSCASPIFAAIGGHYLVFRDETGHLLTDGISMMARTGGRFEPTTRDGPSYDAVLTEGDPWLEAVRSAAKP